MTTRINAAIPLYIILQHNPDNILVYKRLSYLYARQGNTASAVDYLGEALRRMPNDAEANRMLQQLSSQ